MNSIDTSGKIKLTMSLAKRESVLEFLDLSLHINEHNKICVDVQANSINICFTYVLPSTFYPEKNISIAPKGIAFRLGRLCDPDKKFDIQNSEYQNYLTAGEKTSYSILL